MPICSYLVHTRPGSAARATSMLNRIRGCEATLSVDSNYVLLLTETMTEDQEERLQAELTCVPDVAGLTLTFAADASRFS